MTPLTTAADIEAAIRIERFTTLSGPDRVRLAVLCNEIRAELVAGELTENQALWLLVGWLRGCAGGDLLHLWRGLLSIAARLAGEAADIKEGRR